MNLMIDPYEFLAKRTLKILRVDIKKMYSQKTDPTISDGVRFITRETDDQILEALCAVGSSMRSTDTDFVVTEMARRCLRETRKNE